MELLTQAVSFLNLCFTWRWASLVAQMAKKTLPEMQETQAQLLGREGPLEEVTETHSSIPAWRIPRAEKPGRLQSTGLQRVR